MKVLFAILTVSVFLFYSCENKKKQDKGVPTLWCINVKGNDSIYQEF